MRVPSDILLDLLFPAQCFLLRNYISDHRHAALVQAAREREKAGVVLDFRERKSGDY